MERFVGKKSLCMKPGWLVLLTLVAIVLVPAVVWTNELKIPIPRLKEAATAVNQQSAMDLTTPASSECHHRDYQVEPVIDFPQEPNPYGYDLPEGIAISPRGNLYAGMNVSGCINKVNRHGVVSVIADFVTNCDDSNVLGLAVDADETLYVCVWGYNDPSLNGVWRIRPGGEKELIMPIPGAYWGSIPNALTFDNEGNLYATDSGAGSVWRLGKNGDKGLWVQDPLLLGDYFGANGVAYRNHSLWVLNTDRGRIVRIPIEHNGSPGQPEIFVESPLLVGCDGGQFDVRGNMYVAVYYQGYLARVSPRGEVDILITPEEFNGFNPPISPVFGFGKDRSTLFITGMNPHIVKVDVGVPGMLLEQFRNNH